LRRWYKEFSARMLARIFSRHDAEYIPSGRVAVFAVLLIAALMVVVALVMTEASSAGAALQP
jgi:hypothetical protein